MAGELQTTYNDCNGNNFPTAAGHELQSALEKRKEGRLSTFSADKAITIINTLQEGKTVQQACDNAGIARATFYTWCRNSPEFLNAVTEAREDQADSMVDDNVQLLENVDVISEDVDPRRLMAQLRKAEQVARFKFDLAKCLNNKYIEKKQNMNINANVAVTPADISKWFNK